MAFTAAIQRPADTYSEILNLAYRHEPVRPVHGTVVALHDRIDRMHEQTRHQPALSPLTKLAIMTGSSALLWAIVGVPIALLIG